MILLGEPQKRGWRMLASVHQCGCSDRRAVPIGHFERKAHENRIALSQQRVEVHQRRVSTTLRHMLMEFSEFFHVSWTGLLIQASVGTTGGFGALRTKRSG